MALAFRQQILKALFLRKQQKIKINMDKITNMALNMARDYRPFVSGDEGAFLEEVRQIVHLAVLEALQSFDPGRKTDFTSWVYFYLRNIMNSTFANGGKVTTTEITVNTEDMQAIFDILEIKPAVAVTIIFSERDREDMQKLAKINTFLKEHYDVVLTSKRLEIKGNRIKGRFKKYIKPVSLEALREDAGFEIPCKDNDDDDDKNEDNTLFLFPDAEQADVFDCLCNLIEKLPSLHKKIILGLYGLFGHKRKTYGDLSEELGLTEQRIRQMEKEILSYLQKKLISCFPTK